MSNHLYYGDNLQVLRDSIGTETVDLIYLDPPFNSNASYNLLFKSPDGGSSAAQIEAFDDTWHWNDSAEDAYAQVLRSGQGAAAEMLRAMRTVLGENDMMAYLAMMAARLIELHRVLKPTGSLYLHCDPTASHYLKILLDGVFSRNGYRNEIVWQRQIGGKSDAKQYGRNSDRIFFYTKSADFFFDPPRLTQHNEKTIKDWYNKSDPRGPYVSRPLTAAGPSGGDSGKEWRGKSPTGHWTVPRILQERYEKETGRTLEGSVRERLDVLADAKYIDFSSSGLPSWRRYLDEAELPRVHDIWADELVRPISRTSDERLGYPTQKPVALLERILNASSNPDDVVLDPFCGCGTTVHAAEKLGRQWIGIDVTHLAIGLIEKRLRDAFPSVNFTTHGVPQDLAAAQDLAARGQYHEFEKWALSLIGAQPGNLGKKGADKGLDGRMYFGKTGLAVVSVKAGANVGVSMIRDLKGVIEREKAGVGVFLTLTEPTKPMVAEAAAAGQFTEAGFAPVPRLQIVTVAQAMALRERAVELPARRDDTFKKAARDERADTQGRLDL